MAGNPTAPPRRSARTVSPRPRGLRGNSSVRAPAKAACRVLSRGPLAVEVLDRGLVTPGDLIAREAEDRRDPIALQRARRPPAQYDRRHSLLVHVRALGKLSGVDPALDAELLDAPW